MTLTARIKNSFVAGIILLAPLAVTLYVLRLLVNWLLQFVDPVVEWTGIVQYTANDHLTAQVVTTALILVAVVVVGYLAQRESARRTFGAMGRIVNVVPLVNVIYGSVRQVADALVERESRYESVVLVEYPRDGLYSVGLVTGDSPAEVDPIAGPDAVNVFLPNSPNPTAGRLVVVPDEQVHEIDMNAREGMRLLITTGLGDETEPMLDEFAVE
ncbi:MAG: DUF502 domain-containing protein [Haloarculaceae archaeon]